MRPSVSAFVCASVLSLADPALAEDFRVSVFADEYDGVCDAHCSLRDAITAHNQLPGAERNRIILQAGTYNLSLAPEYSRGGVVVEEDQNLNGDLDILGGNLAILGAGRDATFIDAGRIDRILDVLPRDVSLLGDLDLRDLTLSKGRASTSGGAMRAFGRVSIWNTRFRSNYVNYPYGGGTEDAIRGGAIYNKWSLAIYDSIFEGNGIRIGGRPAQGGAVFNERSLKIRDTLFRSNSVVTVGAEAAGAAIYNIGEANVGRMSILDSRGDTDGIAVRNWQGKMTLHNSTVTGSSADSGTIEVAAVASQGGTLSLINVTIAGNAVGGLNNTFGNLMVVGTLIADNPGINCFTGTPARLLNGLLLGLDSSNCRASVYVDNADVYNKVIYPLKDSGNGLPSFALPASSPAIDAGRGYCSSVDQRLYPRPQDGDGDGVAICDLGAYERGGQP